MTTDMDEIEKLRKGWLDQAARDCTEIVRLEAEIERLRSGRAAVPSDEVVEALREMIEVCAAMARVIHEASEVKADIFDDLEDQLKDANIPNGFGVRARAAIEAYHKATGGKT